MSTIPKPGEVLAAKYRIERTIAEGGMGVVVEAMHLQLEERVAIKFLKPEVLGADQTGDATTRFLREARAAIKIRSEHVVRIYDVAALEGGAPYIVMEFLEGSDLEHVLEARGPMPPAEAVDHVLQACEALSEAHALGIVHRDLKPANLFLTKTAAGVPIVKVLDFGISKLGGPPGQQSMSMTSTQAVMGSPLYMSPEQMRATKDADARSDIWAIGVILYELLAGRPPFTGETMTQVCAAILQDTPVRLASLRSDVSPELEKVILHCLEKRPQDRYPDIALLAEALAPFASLVGQEAARRTSRSTAFAQGRASAISEREIPVNAPARTQNVQSATSTAWGDTSSNTKKSRTPVIAAGIGLFAVVAVGGGLMLSKTGPKPDAAKTALTAPESPAPSSSALGAPSPASAPSEAAPAPPATTTVAATAEPTAKAAPSAVASASPKPAVKKPAAAAAAAKPASAPASPSPTPKASWNERK